MCVHRLQRWKSVSALLTLPVVFRRLLELSPCLPPAVGCGFEHVVHEHGGTTGRETYLPADDDLAEAYLQLESLADPDRRTVTTDSAVSHLANKLNKPKKTVKPNILRPLERRGYIRPKYGRIRVAAPDEVV